jgi:hypothetical protein
MIIFRTKSLALFRSPRTFYLKLIRIEVFHFERCAKGHYLHKSEDIWVMLIIGWPDLPVWEKFLGFLVSPMP